MVKVAMVRQILEGSLCDYCGSDDLELDEIYTPGRIFEVAVCNECGCDMEYEIVRVD